MRLLLENRCFNAFQYKTWSILWASWWFCSFQLLLDLASCPFNFMRDGPSFYDLCSIGKGKIMINQPQKLQFQQVWVRTQLDDPPWDCGCLIFRQSHVMGRVCWSFSSWLALKLWSLLQLGHAHCADHLWKWCEFVLGNLPVPKNDPKWLFFYSIWNMINDCQPCNSGLAMGSPFSQRWPAGLPIKGSSLVVSLSVGLPTEADTGAVLACCCAQWEQHLRIPSLS